MAKLTHEIYHFDTKRDGNQKVGTTFARGTVNLHKYSPQNTSLNMSTRQSSKQSDDISKIAELLDVLKQTKGFLIKKEQILAR